MSLVIGNFVYIIFPLAVIITKIKSIWKENKRRQQKQWTPSSNKQMISREQATRGKMNQTENNSLSRSMCSKHCCAARKLCKLAQMKGSERKEELLFPLNDTQSLLSSICFSVCALISVNLFNNFCFFFCLFFSISELWIMWHGGFCAVQWLCSVGLLCHIAGSQHYGCHEKNYHRWQIHCSRFVPSNWRIWFERDRYVFILPAVFQMMPQTTHKLMLNSI